MTSDAGGGPVRVLAFVGTRPEAIKMAPVVVCARDHGDLQLRLVNTGQHPTAATQALTSLGLTADVELHAHRPEVLLSAQVAVLVEHCGAVIAHEQPQLVLVQGDTSTTYAAAMAAFYAGVPVVHLEAGLHTPTLHSPFPEEAHRRLLRTIAQLHLAPTPNAARHLAACGVAPEQVLVTGNTVVDAVLQALQQPAPELPFDPHRQLVVVTAHRRESWGQPLRHLAQAVRTLAEHLPHVEWCIVQHPNPVLAQVIAEEFAGIEHLHVIPPQPYVEFIHLVRRATLVITDSGGLQEELPTLGVPVLVARESTERTEGLDTGAAVQVGTHPDVVVAEALKVLHHPPARATSNPYGDGQAAQRVCQALLWALGRGERPDEFRPS